MRFAVIFKTYTWDSFNERQARRFAEATPQGDFFISIDETNAKFPSVPFDRVVRTSNAELLRSGLANRFEQGSLIWWNADYPHYTFHREFGEYDYYVFVEYDTVIQMPIADLIERMAADGADFAALPIRTPIKDWFWTQSHTQVYPVEQLRGTLNCVAVFSNRALSLLRSRRVAMAEDPAVTYWPSSEVFVPTELARAGYECRSLDEFGDTSRYDWYPPTLEADLPELSAHTFLHPVLDQNRYVAVNLRSNASLSHYLRPSSALRRSLARLPARAYVHLLPGAVQRRLRLVLRQRIKLARVRLRNLMSA